MTTLKPCPFCGGKAKRHTLPRDDFGNDGGDVIECTQCWASSHVEFGRKENIVSAWNTRANQLITTAEADARVEAAVLAEREACAEILDAKAADHDADAARFRGGSDPHHNRSFLAKTAREHAAAIRSRGVTG